MYSSDPATTPGRVIRDARSSMRASPKSMTRTPARSDPRAPSTAPAATAAPGPCGTNRFSGLRLPCTTPARWIASTASINAPPTSPIHRRTATASAPTSHPAAACSSASDRSRPRIRSMARNGRPSAVWPRSSRSGATGGPTRASASPSPASLSAAASVGARLTLIAAARPSASRTAAQVVANPPEPSHPPTANPATAGAAPSSPPARRPGPAPPSRGQRAPTPRRRWQVGQRGTPHRAQWTRCDRVPSW